MKAKRILSIDGGGIYGLMSARWLRKLCERTKDFLSGEVWLFAGCSSGAVNSLLLATHDRPREVVLDGVLERFWSDEGTFSNTDPDPFAQALSWMGVTGWFGEKDFLKLLQQHFKNAKGGQLTLGELKQNVLISTFNWTGGKPHFPPALEGEGTPASSTALLVAEMTSRLTQMWTQPMTPIQPEEDTSGNHGWRPYMFTNLEKQDAHYSVADVAYGAATPPGFRALRGGIGDGASFSASPTADAIGFAVKYRRDQIAAQGAKIASIIGDALMKRADYDPRRTPLHGALEDIWLLSLGDGTFIPEYKEATTNVGFSLWGSMPANPQDRGSYPPTAYSLQPAGEAARLIALALLGERFHRMNPDLSEMPTVVAAYVAKWPPWRAAILEGIRHRSDCAASETCVEDALRFLRAERWVGVAP